MAQVSPASEDSMITRAVSLEIAADPSISSHAQISVASEHGIVRLEGSVPHSRAAERAVAAAQRTMGVRGVVERLRIQTASRTDAAVEQDLERLVRGLNSRSRADVRFALREGRVVLAGSVKSRAYRELMEALVWAIEGVRRVTNELVMVPSRERHDSVILRDVSRRIRADAELQGTRLAVDVTNGQVTVMGEVATSEQRRRARTLAWVPGVRIVQDEVVVRVASGDRFVAIDTGSRGPPE
jgi:hyperosmotically inducible periplasmic protein